MSTRNRGMFDCAFCRTPTPDDDAGKLALIWARAEKKDPEAINVLGQKYFHGELGLQKDTRKAIELMEEAAELGSIEALFNLGIAYELGEGVEQDKAKRDEFFERAAMQGSVLARHNLGTFEVQRGNHRRAVRHFLISAKMGYNDSLDTIKLYFEMGIATKEQYAQALKGYQDAAEEMKSHDRDEANRL